MKITASHLRQNIYRLFDQVIEKGTVLEVERKGQILTIAPVKRKRLFDKLTPHACVKGNPQDLVHMDWYSEWKP